MPSRTAKTQAPAPRGRGLVTQAKLILKATRPVRFGGVGNSKWKAFRRVDPSTSKVCGLPLKGLTKQLEDKIFSNGSLPWYKTVRTSGTKKGSTGRRRGTYVDKTLSKLVNTSGTKAVANVKINSRSSEPRKLTAIVGKAIVTELGLRMLIAQRGVCHLGSCDRHRRHRSRR